MPWRYQTLPTALVLGQRLRCLVGGGEECGNSGESEEVQEGLRAGLVGQEGPADGPHQIKSSVFAHWEVTATHSTREARVTPDLSARDLIRENI